ncbi:MAG: GntR family transcriptional regulator [Clostridiales bacterium]|nr:GntR family transcriptional regulator [Clostridiales bacterium]
MFSINFQSRKPIYDQIYSNVLKQIAIGELQPGDKLPTVRLIASELGVNPNTASKAYQMLERDGYIYSVVGKGSFVADSANGGEIKLGEIRKKLFSAVKDAVEYGIEKEILQKSFNETLNTLYKGGMGE